MAVATIRILHRSMTVPILPAMPLLRALRAIIILLGFLALAPAQAGGAVAEAKVVAGMGRQGDAALVAARKDIGAVLGAFQFGTPCPDDGLSPGSVSLSSPTGLAAGPAGFAEPPFRHAATQFRLDRPPKSA